ncbi:hypothetical protein NLL45_07465 [Corynebacterium propinquum]|uniref:hypothetical protein n=1 Tax=Corynebacterium propinquum TaxID=43769 RepID=UPI002670AA7F|nr:hypothetical protein [Corynebacterium propinquum]WKS31371.1 hypothetical protein NLL45_07465 [Corynebacterium propinquum]WKS35749.1 hypothetical protein NLL30_07780 [Corynebacterium propinquum]WKS37652.1 hypothetical protein NLL34_06265 [Corynebacterium propinquum]WKS41888.1 hypothetical protein NLL42_05860 [Corynebacterium propinquum]WKS48054.1 hypothetical protein NLL47_05160 [Corynebacterium propinquum]
MNFLQFTDTALDLLATHAQHQFAPRIAGAASTDPTASTPTLAALRHAEGSWYDTAVDIDSQLQAHLTEMRGTFCALAENDEAMAHHLNHTLSASKGY